MKLHTAIPSRVEWGEMGVLWGSSDHQKCCAGSLLAQYCCIQGCIRHTEERQLPSCVANQTALHQQASIVVHTPPPPSPCLLPELPTSMAPPSGGVTIATGSGSNHEVAYPALFLFQFFRLAYWPPLLCMWCYSSVLMNDTAWTESRHSLSMTSFDCQMRLEEVQKGRSQRSRVHFRALYPHQLKKHV